jgi:hypothetical protein
MPFGKHRGSEIADLPDDYLEWLLGLGDGLREPLRSAVTAEWRSRQRPTAVVKALPEPVVSAAQQIVTAGYRKLAIERHPDRGGETGQMTALNLAAEVLRDWLREAA